MRMLPRHARLVQPGAALTIRRPVGQNDVGRPEQATERPARLLPLDGQSNAFLAAIPHCERGRAARAGVSFDFDHLGPCFCQQETGHRERSEEHTSELQSLMRISYAVFCLKKKKTHKTNQTHANDNTTITTQT